jgi:hypothetical protein
MDRWVVLYSQPCGPRLIRGHHHGCKHSISLEFGWWSLCFDFDVRSEVKFESYYAQWRSRSGITPC